MTCYRITAYITSLFLINCDQILPLIYIHVQTICFKSLYKPYCIRESFTIHISTYIRSYSLTTGSIIFKIIIVFFDIIF